MINLQQNALGSNSLLFICVYMRFILTLVLYNATTRQKGQSRIDKNKVKSLLTSTCYVFGGGHRLRLDLTLTWSVQKKKYIYVGWYHVSYHVTKICISVFSVLMCLFIPCRLIDTSYNKLILLLCHDIPNDDIWW